MRQAALFGESARLQMNESIELTIASFLAHAVEHDHWAFAWSGGKDSTATLTIALHLLDAGKIPRPKSLTVLFADTRMELLPLWLSARSILDQLADRGIAAHTVMAPLEDRFLPYILGRGVPPPNNNTLRWCTEAIKIAPMARALEALAVGLGLGHYVDKLDKQTGQMRLLYEGFGRGKILTLTGVRRGESAARDQRIALSCAGNNAECGQGWYQKTLPTGLCDTLAPIDWWRVCHVWEWLKHWAPRPEFGDWDTELLAEAYGGDEAEENEARTGCMGCPLAEHDPAIESLIRRPAWSYLTPLRELRPIYREMRKATHRLRQPGGERRKDGTLVANQQRMGPLTIEARRHFLARLLDLQARVNAAADAAGRPRIDFLNGEEVAFIERCHAEGLHPNKWTGDEPLATKLLPAMFADGTEQPLLPGLEEP